MLLHVKYNWISIPCSKIICIYPPCPHYILLSSLNPRESDTKYMSK
jgi:hypothetical protein